MSQEFDYQRDGKQLRPTSAVHEVKKVYICHPLGADFEKNVTRVKSVLSVITGLMVQRYRTESIVNNDFPNLPWGGDSGDHDLLPLAPYLAFVQFTDDKNAEHRALSLAWDLKVLDDCKELWVIGQHVSYGMQIEISHAAMKRMRVRWFDYEDFELDFGSAEQASS